MKIAVCTQQKNEQSTVDNRFGRAACFAVFDDETSQWSFIENAQNTQAAQGAGIQAAQFVIDAGVNVLLACNVGPKAVCALQAGQVKIYTMSGGGTAVEAVKEYQNGNLEQMTEANVEGHWG